MHNIFVSINIFTTSPPCFQNRPIIVLCNLKPRNMRGIKCRTLPSFKPFVKEDCSDLHFPLIVANGMVLCASDASHERVEPLRPAEGAPVGQRIWFGEGGQDQVRAGGQEMDEGKQKNRRSEVFHFMQAYLITNHK